MKFGMDFDVDAGEIQGPIEHKSVLCSLLKNNRNNQYSSQRVSKKEMRQRIEYLSMLADQGLDLFPEIKGYIEYKNENNKQIDTISN
jgi:hypothetical protein